MATLLELCDSGCLDSYVPDLMPDELVQRRVFFRPCARNWIDNVLPMLASTWNLEVSPIEQAAAILDDFCAGVTLGVANNLRPLRPANNGIWEIKTADLRFFGWFPVKDHFLVSACNHAETVKIYNLYNGYIEEAVRFRNQLNIDEPKFITGDLADDVVSNWHQSK